MKPFADPGRLVDEPSFRHVMQSAALDADPRVLGRVAARLAATGLIAGAASSALASVSTIPSASTVVSTSAPAGLAASSSAVVQGASALLGWKLAVVALALAGTAAVVTVAMVARPIASRAPTVPVSEGAPVAASTADLVPHAEPHPDAAPIASEPEAARPPPIARRRVVTPAAPTLAEEVELIARMRATVDADPRTTLALAAEHRARFGEHARFGADRDRYESRARATLSSGDVSPDEPTEGGARASREVAP